MCAWEINRSFQMVCAGYMPITVLNGEWRESEAISTIILAPYRSQSLLFLLFFDVEHLF